MADKINVDAASQQRLRGKAPSGAGSGQVVGAEKSDEDLAKGKDTEKLTSGLGTVKTAKGGGADMPKQRPDEDPHAFGERMRQWRDAQRDGKKDAVGGLLKARQAEAKGAY